MSRRRTALLISVTCLLVSGCSGLPGMPGNVTKAYEAPLTFHSYQDPQAELRAQTQALESMAEDLVLRATLRGAATGAAIGCGAALILAGGVTECAASAALAGTAGGLIGHQRGKAQVARSVQEAETEKLDQHLEGLRGQTARVTGNLSSYLAAQEAELARLRSDHAAGRIPQARLEAKLAEVRQSRAALALALDRSAADVSRARETMAETSSRQSVDLQYQMKMADQLEDDIQSARASISLL